MVNKFYTSACRKTRESRVIRQFVSFCLELFLYRCPEKKVRIYFTVFLSFHFKHALKWSIRHYPKIISIPHAG